MDEQEKLDYVTGEPVPNIPDPSTYPEQVNAGLILALGIASLFCGLGIVLGPITWVMSQKALAKIDGLQAYPGKRGNIVIGRLCAILGFLGSVLWLITVWASAAKFLSTHHG